MRDGVTLPPVLLASHRSINLKPSKVEKKIQRKAKVKHKTNRPPAPASALTIIS